MSSVFVKSLKRRAVVVRRQRIALGTAGLLIVILSVLFIFSNTHTVKAGNNNHKYFTHILIEENDTIWDIAEQYMTSEYASTNAYIYEVEQINHIDADKIVAGCYIMIPYYAETPLNQD